MGSELVNGVLTKRQRCTIRKSLASKHLSQEPLFRQMYFKELGSIKQIGHKACKETVPTLFKSIQSPAVTFMQMLRNGKACPAARPTLDIWNINSVMHHLQLIHLNCTHTAQHEVSTTRITSHMERFLEAFGLSSFILCVIPTYISWS